MNMNHRKCLLKWLNTEFSEEGLLTGGDDISATSVKFDIMLDCARFLDKHGLVEKDMKLFINFFSCLFNETVCKELPIEDAVSVTKEKITSFLCNGKFSASFVKSSIDYITTTVLQHYHLMVYVMNNARNEDLSLLTEYVEVPPLPEPLNEATRFSVWEMESRVKEKEKEFEQQKLELDSKFSDIQAKLNEEIGSYMSSMKDTPLNSSTVVDMVSTLLLKHTDLTNAQLEALVESSKHEIILKIDKIKILADSK